jgi:hypothetical protein
MSIGDKIYQDFEHEKDPSKLWTMLQRRFASTDAFMPVLLHNETMDLSLSGSKDMQAYLSSALALEEWIVIRTTLKNLTAAYDTFRTIKHHDVRTKKVHFDTLVDEFIAEEYRLSGETASSNYAKTKGSKACKDQDRKPQGKQGANLLHLQEGQQALQVLTHKKCFY